jgi:hypothetical protein
MDSPIGPITADENTYIHSHPINMTAYMADASYKQQVLAQPAMAATAVQDGQDQNPGPQQASTLTHWGFFCAGGGATGCINDWGGSGDIKFGSGASSDNVNGQFNQWYDGQVVPTWPVNNTPFYEAYKNNSIFRYAWAPHGNGSGECISSILGKDQGLITAGCAGSHDEQYIWNGGSKWVNVLWTADSYENNPTPVAWYAGSASAGVNDGTWVATKSGGSLRWHLESVQ